MNTSQALTPLLALIGVVALIPVALWLMRRSGVVGGGQNHLLQTVSTLALSPSQRVVVVALRQGALQRWMVLGVTGESITNLLTVDAPEEVPLEIREPQAPTVAQLLSKWRQGPMHGGQP